MVGPPQPPQTPKVPQAPGRRRTFEREGVTMRPLAGPKPEVPAVEDEELMARYSAWHAETNGSLPEFIVREWLLTKKRQIEGLDFIFQWPILGGRTQYGGFLLDFFFPLKRVGWQVQGLRWHLLEPNSRARDQLSKMILTQQSIRVIELWEDDVLVRPDYVLPLAWEGYEANPGRGRPS